MTTPEPEQSPWTQPRVLVAMVVVAVIAALAAVLVVTAVLRPDEGAGQAAPDTGAPTTTPDPGTASAAPEAAGEPSVCGLPAVELSGSLPTPPEAEWELVGTTAAPRSDEHGPGVVDDDGFRSCFARTPEGALFAAANIVALGSDASLGPRITEELTFDGPGRDAALQAPAASGSSEVSLQIEGFRLLNYTGETAEVELALRTSRGAYVAQVFPLVWDEGDWKVRLAPEGALPTGLVQLPDLTGYTLWAGA